MEELPPPGFPFGILVLAHRLEGYKQFTTKGENFYLLFKMPRICSLEAAWLPHSHFTLSQL
jgi:hypothetical protein